MGAVAARSLWDACKPVLGQHLEPSKFQMHVPAAQLFLEDDNAFVITPNKFSAEFLDQNCHELLLDLLNQESVLEKQQALCGDSTAVERIHFLVGDEGSIPSSPRGPKARAHSLSAKYSEASDPRDLVRIANEQLINDAQEGRFKLKELTPSQNYPRCLTRLPIFGTMSKRARNNIVDADGAIAFENSWGRGRIFGVLSAYDEDTLIALARLRKKHIEGRPSNLPCRLQGDGKSVKVDVVVCLISDLQRELGVAQGGNNNKQRLASVKRLAAASIEIEKCKDAGEWHGANVRFFDLKWLTTNKNDPSREQKTAIQVQFSPEMVGWLHHHFTYINWKVRRSLTTDLAKSLHGFLSGQPKKYSIRLLKLQTILGYTSTYSNFRVGLNKALDELVELKWLLAETKIEGTGRKTPHKLTAYRPGWNECNR